MVKWHLQVENPLASINDERESLSKSGAKFHPSFLIKSMLCLFARRRQISRPLDIEVNSCEANGQTHESWMNVFIPRWIQRGAILAIFSDASNFLWFIRTLADKHRVVFSRSDLEAPPLLGWANIFGAHMRCLKRWTFACILVCWFWVVGT